MKANSMVAAPDLSVRREVSPEAAKWGGNPRVRTLGLRHHPVMAMAWSVSSALLGCGISGCAPVDTVGVLLGDAGQGGSLGVQAEAARGGSPDEPAGAEVTAGMSALSNAGTHSDPRTSGGGADPGTTMSNGAADPRGGATHEPSAGSPPAEEAFSPETPSCHAIDDWLLYARVDLLAVPELELLGDVPSTLDLLLVDDECTFWVRNAAAGRDVRTGQLTAEQAAELWNVLGPAAREGLPSEQGRADSQALELLQDPSSALVCFGECAGAETDVRVAELFDLARGWTADLYQEGALYDGGVLVLGVPVPGLPLAPVAWPLTEPLAEFFSEPGATALDSFIRVEGEEADALRELQGQAEEQDPALAPLILTEDAEGDRYLVLIEEAGPSLPESVESIRPPT